MRLIHDVPESLVESIGADRPMLIAYAEEVNSNAAYRDFYLEALQDRKFVILSSVEQLGAGVVTDLVEAAVRLKPSEVVLPNLPKTPEKSARLTAEVSSLLQSAGVVKTPFMAVPQGEDFHEYLTETTRLSTFSQVRTIGVTADVFEKYNLTHKKFALAMRKACPRTLHLLGLSNSLADLKDPGVTSLFRSCNTPKAVVWGLSGVAVPLATKRVPAYPGRAEFGGASGFLSYTTDDTVKIEKANSNINEWDG